MTRQQSTNSPSLTQHLSVDAVKDLQVDGLKALSRLDGKTLQEQPERAKLAMLAAAGHMQENNHEEAKNFIRLARHWGCNKKYIAKTLAVCVYASLGRAAGIQGNHKHMLHCFDKAIALGLTSSLPERLDDYYSSDHSDQVEPEKLISSLPVIDHTQSTSSTVERNSGEEALYNQTFQFWIAGDWPQLTKQDNATLALMPGRADLILFAAAGYQQQNDMSGTERCCSLAVQWGCDKDKVQTLMAAGIRNTMALIETVAGHHRDAAIHFRHSLRTFSPQTALSDIERRVDTQLVTLGNIDIKKAFNEIMIHLKDDKDDQ